MGERRAMFCTHTKTGNETGKVDVPRCEHVKLLKAGNGSCLNKRVWMILCNCAPHQAWGANGWNGGPIALTKLKQSMFAIFIEFDVSDNISKICLVTSLHIQRPWSQSPVKNSSLPGTIHWSQPPGSHNPLQGNQKVIRVLAIYHSHTDLAQGNPLKFQHNTFGWTC